MDEVGVWVGKLVVVKEEFEWILLMKFDGFFYLYQDVKDLYSSHVFVLSFFVTEFFLITEV